MKFLGEIKGYQCFINSGGFIEGYKSSHFVDVDKNNKLPTRIKRIVSNATTIDGFFKFINKKKVIKKPYNPHNDENQLKIL